MKLKEVNQKQFARAYVETNGNATEAVQRMYPDRSYKSCSVTGTRLLKDTETQELIINTMERRGITDAVLVDKLKKLLEAKKALVCDKQIVEVDDNGTMVESLKVALKLKGHLDAPNVPSLTIGMKIENTEDIDRLERIADRLERLADRPLYTVGQTVEGEVVPRRKADAPEECSKTEQSAETASGGGGGGQGK